MQTVGNILWLIFVGIWLAIAFVVAGIVMFVLIITVPFGIQAFKLAGFALWPFGRHVEDRVRVTCPLHIICNIILIIFGGLYLAIHSLRGGALPCITILPN